MFEYHFLIHVVADKMIREFPVEQIFFFCSIWYPHPLLIERQMTWFVQNLHTITLLLICYSPWEYYKKLFQYIWYHFSFRWCCSLTFLPLVQLIFRFLGYILSYQLWFMVHKNITEKIIENMVSIACLLCHLHVMLRGP